MILFAKVVSLLVIGAVLGIGLLLILSPEPVPPPDASSRHSAEDDDLDTTYYPPLAQPSPEIETPTEAHHRHRKSDP